uniref:Cytoskeleton associated protein 2 like n=1 Tax=Ficedula albicollis TaxID=59894 RepID=A0A803VA08_FICAL
MAGAREDGRLGAKSMQHAGHTVQKKLSNTSQGAGRVQPANIMTLPASMQTSGKLPPSASGHVNPERSRKPAQETVTAAAAQAGSDHPPPGAPHSLSKGLQGRLVCHKENLNPQASTCLESMRTFQSDANSLRKTGVLAHRQSSAVTSKPVLGPKGRISNQQPQEALVVDKFRKTLPESKSISQNTSIGTQPLQPSGLLSASTNLLHKNSGTKEGETTMVRQPGTAPGGSLKHHSQPPPVRFPTKPPTLGNPQGLLNPGVTLPPRRPTVKEGMDRKDMKVVLPGHTAAGQGTGHPNQSCSWLHSSNTHVLEDGLRREQLKPELPKAGGMQARRIPRTPSAADRKKQLEEWLASKGKKYKRPPMAQLQKQAVKPSYRKVKAKENQEHPEQHCQATINSILTECLKLIEEGVCAEELSAVLSLVPQAEKFAKFWICQAKLLARSGPFDVLQLYREAVIAGAEPIEELRETVLNILKDAGQKLEGEKAEEPIPWEPRKCCPGERQPIASTPGLAGRPMTSLPLSVKLQVTPASRSRLGSLSCSGDSSSSPRLKETILSSTTAWRGMADPASAAGPLASPRGILASSCSSFGQTFFSIKGLSEGLDFISPVKRGNHYQTPFHHCTQCQQQAYTPCHSDLWQPNKIYSSSTS